MFVDLPWENSWATVVNQAANCLWELLELLLLLLPPEWQLLLFSWLDKYKLWEFNSHQRLVLVRIYIHTQTRHTLLQSVLLFVSMATFCGLLHFVEFCFDLFVVIGDFCILLFPLRCSLKSSQFIHFQCDVIGI